MCRFTIKDNMNELFHDAIQFFINIFWNLPAIYTTHLYLLVTKPFYREITSSFNSTISNSCTVFKCLQLYYAAQDVKADKIQIGIGIGPVASNVILLQQGRKTVGTLSVCRCCSNLGMLRYS